MSQGSLKDTQEKDSMNLEDIYQIDILQSKIYSTLTQTAKQVSTKIPIDPEDELKQLEFDDMSFAPGMSPMSSIQSAHPKIISEIWRLFLRGDQDLLKGETSLEDYFNFASQGHIFFWKLNIAGNAALAGIMIFLQLFYRFVLRRDIGLDLPAMSPYTDIVFNENIALFSMMLLVSLMMIWMVDRRATMTWATLLRWFFVPQIVGGVTVGLTSLFLQIRGPSIILTLAVASRSLYPVFVPKMLPLYALLASAVEICSFWFRMTVPTSPDAPSFKTDCRDPSQSLDGPGCVEQTLASIVFYFQLIIIGYYSLQTVEIHVKQLYLQQKNFRLETEACQEVEAETSKYALSLVPEKLWANFKANGQYNIRTLLKEQSVLCDYQNVTILFCDIVGSSKLHADKNPEKLVQLLDSIFTEFDDCVASLGLEKIKTFGCCYVACAGVPTSVSDGELRVLCLGKRMNSIIQSIALKKNIPLELRIGIHRGQVWGGILGVQRISFDIWSRDVAIVAMMESTGTASRIQVTEAVMSLTRSRCKYSEGAKVKFQGTEIQTYFFEDFDQPFDLGPAVFGSKAVSRKSLHLPPSNPLLSEKQSSRKEIRYLVNDGLKIDPNACNILFPFTNRFRDATIEAEYQKECLKTPSRRFLYSMIIMQIICDISFIFHCLSSDFSLPVILALFPMLVTGYLLMGTYEALAEPGSMSTNFTAYNWIGVLGPLTVLVLYLSAASQLLALHQLSSVYHFFSLYLTIFSCLIFRQAPAYRMSLTAVLIVVIFNLLEFLIPSPNLGYNSQHFGYYSFIVELHSVLTISVSLRKTERETRIDYLNSRQIVRKRAKTETLRRQAIELLGRFMPLNVVKRLKENPKLLIADQLDEAVVLFAEVRVANEVNPNFREIAHLRYMNEIFTAFDSLLQTYQVEKIKSIGQTYLVIATGNSCHHRLAAFALELKQIATEFNVLKHGHVSIALRIGISTGPIIAGVVGKTKVSYDIWGETVNLASQLKILARDDTIHITTELAQLLDDLFELEVRGSVSVKGKGDIITYLLKGNKLDID